MNAVSFLHSNSNHGWFFSLSHINAKYTTLSTCDSAIVILARKWRISENKRNCCVWVSLEPNQIMWNFPNEKQQFENMNWKTRTQTKRIKTTRFDSIQGALWAFPFEASRFGRKEHKIKSNQTNSNLVPIKRHKNNRNKVITWPKQMMKHWQTQLKAHPVSFLMVMNSVVVLCRS